MGVHFTENNTKSVSPSSSSFVMVTVRPLSALTTERRERGKGGGAWGVGRVGVGRNETVSHIIYNDVMLRPQHH